MNILEATGTTNAAIFRPVEGVSEESLMIMAILERISDERRKVVSFAWRDSLLDEVEEIIRTCSNEGWDGYDAEPISRESGFRVAQLIELLPEGIQMPNVVAEPTGDIALEWLRGNEKHFTLSITGPQLVYAGIFGGSDKRYGEKRFLQELPSATLEILTSYFPEA